MSVSEHAVEVLNDLIETALGSVHGYEEAAKAVREGDLKTVFERRSRKRMALTRELQEEVRSFGGQPEDDRSFLGKAHDRLVELKSALAGGAETSVVDQVERSEDQIKAKFEKVLREEKLPPGARAVVSRGYAEIRIDHDSVSALKQAMH